TLGRPLAQASGRLEGWKQHRAWGHPSRRSRDFVARTLRMTLMFVARLRPRKRYGAIRYGTAQAEAIRARYDCYPSLLRRADDGVDRSALPVLPPAAHAARAALYRDARHRRGDPRRPGAAARIRQGRASARGTARRLRPARARALSAHLRRPRL